MGDEVLDAFTTLIDRFDKVGGSDGVSIRINRELNQELENRYKQMVRDRVEAGEEPPLRRLDFYPAVIQAALNETSIEEELIIHDL